MTSESEHPRSADFDRVLDAIMLCGLMLESHPQLPSVVTEVIGEPVVGSWRKHERGRDIERITRDLAQHPDVLTVRLICGRTTYAHIQLWPAIFAIATSNASWQIDGLSSAAQALLEQLEYDDELRTDRLPPALEHTVPDPVDAALELERRLLVHGSPLPGATADAGDGGRQLRTWSRWGQDAGLYAAANSIPPGEARSLIEEVVTTLNEGHEARVWLPWDRSAQ